MSKQSFLNSTSLRKEKERVKKKHQKLPRAKWICLRAKLIVKITVVRVIRQELPDHSFLFCTKQLISWTVVDAVSRTVSNLKPDK